MADRSLSLSSRSDTCRSSRVLKSMEAKWDPQRWAPITHNPPQSVQERALWKPCGRTASRHQ